MLKKITSILLCVIILILTCNCNVYAKSDANAVLQDFINNNITSNMSNYDKLVAITKYVAENYDYKEGYNTYSSMIENGGGTCIASTSMICKLCSMVGIDCRSRSGAKESGAGSAHVNAIALIDGKYYVAEAGYAGTKPRPYNVFEEPMGYMYTINKDNTVTIDQYDGFDENVIIPSEIDGHTVTTIANKTFNSNVKTVVLPNTVTKLEDEAFYFCIELEKVTLSNNLKEIGKDVFYYCNKLQSIKIPDSVQVIKGANFKYCTSLKNISVGKNFTIEDNILYSADKTKIIEALPRI